MFIPSHAAACEEIAPLAQYNIDCVMEIAERICGICERPRGFEDILQQLFLGYGLTMTQEQSALVGSTVRSYLTWLEEQGRLRVTIENAKILWQA